MSVVLAFEDESPEIQSKSFVPPKRVVKKSPPRSPKRSPSRSPKKSPKRSPRTKASTNSIIILKELNLSLLDKQYALHEIAHKQEREVGRGNDSDDAKHIATSLERLGISSAKKEPIETIYWGDSYKIKLFINKNINLETSHLKCSWCHHFPPEGALTLAVPFKYIPSYIHEHVYAPECINVVDSMDVVHTFDEKKRYDPKNTPKVNYFRRSVCSNDRRRYENTDRIIENEYFECAYPVCSFSCMESKGAELAIRDPRFSNVRMLISFMYSKIFDVKPVKINPAPPCYILEDYGGDFTIEEYRKNFKFVPMNDTNQFFINNKLNMAGHIFTQCHSNE